MYESLCFQALSREKSMQPIIDHIHITVENIERAEKFYDQLLPLLGFDVSLKEYDCVPEHEYRIIEFSHHNLSLRLVNQRESYTNERPSRRKAGALHHLAFHADSPEEVDSFYLIIQELSVKIIHPPKFYPEYCSDYYALFFKDSEGIEYEIVSFDRERYFPL